jgi:hypothetical protein
VAFTSGYSNAEFIPPSAAAQLSGLLLTASPASAMIDLADLAIADPAETVTNLPPTSMTVQPDSRLKTGIGSPIP